MQNTTIITHLAQKAAVLPDKKVFIFLEDGERAETAVTYAALHEKVERLAGDLLHARLGGKPVLLLYPEGLEFIFAFLACQRAGIIAVPMFLPRSDRHHARLRTIIDDSGAAAVLTLQGLEPKITAGLAGAGTRMPILATDAALPPGAGAGDSRCNPVSFIQYTSGSTGRPKGVTITHRNLLHNQGLIQAAFGCNEQSVIVSWLPFYHDMGLIGNILHAIYAGAGCVLLSPFHFMQKPVRWLRAISAYGGTHSGGPNFAYNLCVDKIEAAKAAELKLHAWRVAYNGSEMVRKPTLDRFAAHFAGAGFAATSFYPCYGLAEATLLVSGRKPTGEEPFHVQLDATRLREGLLVPADDQTINPVGLLSAGQVLPGMEVVIRHPDHDGEAAPGTVGEICIAGESVSGGYWKGSGAAGQPSAPAYRRTGDLGFLASDQLFVTGRSKELVILQGRNYYPYDIELACAGASPAINPDGVVAVAVPGPEAERLVVFAEIKRGAIATLDPAALTAAIKRSIVAQVGVMPHDVVLLKPLAIPRTSSGKLQRWQCARDYAGGTWGGGAGVLAAERPVPATPAAGEALAALVREQKERGPILRYLKILIASRTPGVPPESILETQPLTEAGIDSLRATEIVNAINRDLLIRLDAVQVLQAATLESLAEMIEVSLILTDAKEPINEITL